MDKCIDDRFIDSIYRTFRVHEPKKSLHISSPRFPPIWVARIQREHINQHPSLNTSWEQQKVTFFLKEFCAVLQRRRGLSKLRFENTPSPNRFFGGQKILLFYGKIAYSASLVSYFFIFLAHTKPFFRFWARGCVILFFESSYFINRWFLGKEWRNSFVDLQFASR